MADNPLNDLDYGRPGLTLYDLDDRGWNTSREPTDHVLQQVSEWELAIPAAITFVSTKSSKRATTSRKDVRRLAHDHPQLIPAAKLLPTLGAVSHAVTYATTTYDPHIGDLLSFGTVFLKQSSRPKQIAALPTGPSGSILRLVPLVRQRIGWEGDRSVWLQGSSFGLVDGGYWNEEAAPIQQVTFGQAETGNSFLAVRLPSRTVLFRPSYHRGRQAAQASLYYDLPPSLLSAHPILNITIDETGGAPHAHIAFNPDYQFQFGIIDQQGAWSLWQIERRAKRDEYSVSRIIGGDIQPTEEEVTDAGDGWARIFWAGDSSTLIICTRRQLSLVNVTGETFEYLPTPQIVPQRSSDWILDIKRLPQSQHCFCVLTSARMFVISVKSSSNTDHDASAGATILMSRRHYRGDEDITLQLHPEAFEESTAVFITSRLNKLLQVYHFQDRTSSQPSIMDPAILTFDLPVSANITQLHLKSLEYAAKELLPHTKRNTSAQTSYENAVPFHQITVMTADLSVHQTVLLSSKYDRDPERLAWRKIMARHSVDAKNDVDEMDDFMEPDGPDWEVEPESKLKSQVPQWIINDSVVHATADHAYVYDSLLYSEQAGSTSIEDVFRQFQETMSLEVPKFEANLMETFDTIDVPDIDEASGKLQQLFTSHSTSVLRPIAAQQVLHLPETEECSITGLYDIILENWIASLPTQTPVPVRQAKERLARRVAAEVTLASMQFRPRGHEPATASSSGPASLPILPSKPVDTLPSSLPTPPQSSVPPSSPLFPEGPRPQANDPLSRLRKHLIISDDSDMTPTVVPPSVSELLSHWQPGTDPSSYDWEATEEVFRPDAADEEDQDQREKERKKKERRDRRQRREDELMRAKTQTSSQPLFSQPVYPRSSPGPTFGGMTASSQEPIPTSSQLPNQVHSQGVTFGGFGGFGGMNSLIPQSQVEPGRFGGRPDKKKKKNKGRISGF